MNQKTLDNLANVGWLGALGGVIIIKAGELYGNPSSLEIPD